MISRYGKDADDGVKKIVLAAGLGLKELEALLPAGDPPSRPAAAWWREWFVRRALVAEIARVVSAIAFSIAFLAVIALQPGGVVVTTVLAASIAAAGWAAMRTATTYRDGMVSRLGFLVAVQNAQADELYASHEEAVRILRSFAADGTPYALFLRNFDIEVRYVERGNKKWLISSDSLQPGGVERKVAEHLTRHVPVVAVANTALITKRPGGLLLPYLSLPDDGWMEVVDGLVANASLIVFELRDASAGVSFELETILARGQEDRAVVVLPGDGSVRDLASDAAMSTVLEEAARGPEASGERLDEEFAELDARASGLRGQLARFPRVAAENAVPWEDLDSSPLFHDLLEEARAAARLVKMQPCSPRRSSGAIRSRTG